jgi:hypothetical protein
MSPKVVCPSVPKLMPHTTKSRCGLLVLSLGGGPTPSSSMLIASSGASSALASAWVGTPYRRVVPLPSSVSIASISCAHDIGTSCTRGINISGASYADSPDMGASWCATVGHEELRGTEVRSPMLTADGTNRDGCGGVIGRVADRRVSRVAKVQLLLHANQFFEFREVNWRSRSHISNKRIHMHTKETPIR